MVVGGVLLHGGRLRKVMFVRVVAATSLMHKGSCPGAPSLAIQQETARPVVGGSTRFGLLENARRGH